MAAPSHAVEAPGIVRGSKPASIPPLSLTPRSSWRRHAHLVQKSFSHTRQYRPGQCRQAARFVEASCLLLRISETSRNWTTQRSCGLAELYAFMSGFTGCGHAVPKGYVPQLNRLLPSPLAQRPPGRPCARATGEIGAHASMIDGRSGRLSQLGKSLQPIETK